MSDAFSPYEADTISDDRLPPSSTQPFTLALQSSAYVSYPMSSGSNPSSTSNSPNRASASSADGTPAGGSIGGTSQGGASMVATGSEVDPPSSTTSLSTTAGSHAAIREDDVSYPALYHQLPW